MSSPEPAAAPEHLSRHRDGTGWLADLLRRFVMGSIRAAVRLTGGSISVLGLDHVPPGPVLIAFHHVSPIDAFLMGAPLARRGHVPIAMIKQGLFRVPGLGFIVERTGMVPVPRGSAEGRAAAFDVAAGHLARGHTVFVAPMGTITPSWTILPLRTGAARLAQDAGVPLVPAVVLGINRWGGANGRPFRLRRRTPVEVAYGPPVEQDEDPRVTTEHLRAAFVDLLETAHAAYPEDGTGQWWWPAHLGGSALTHDEAVAALADRRLGGR